jgi:hypothetical protein
MFPLETAVALFNSFLGVVIPLFLVVVVVGARLVRVFSKRKAQPQQADPGILDGQIEPPGPLIPVPGEPPFLATRLHQLEGAFGTFAANSAHPRELTEHPDFQSAVNLLVDLAVSVDV